RPSAGAAGAGRGRGGDARPGGHLRGRHAACGGGGPGGAHMIRAMLWKEWREQRTVAGSVLAFGTLALYLTAQFADPNTGRNVWEGGGPRELMAVALAYLAGAVSGAILLADEKEVGTLEFLDTLPCRRRSLWIGKVLAGGLLAVGQCVFIALLAVVLGSVDVR